METDVICVLKTFHMQPTDGAAAFRLRSKDITSDVLSRKSKCFCESSEKIQFSQLDRFYNVQPILQQNGIPIKKKNSGIKEIPRTSYINVCRLRVTGNPVGICSV